MSMMMMMMMVVMMMMMMAMKPRGSQRVPLVVWGFLFFCGVPSVSLGWGWSLAKVDER